MIHLFGFSTIEKDLLDLRLEETRQLEGEFKRGIILVILNRMDRLPGYTQLTREVLLRDVPHRPEDPKLIL